MGETIIQKNQITISFGDGNTALETFVKKAFDGFNVEISDYKRKSDGHFPIQIMIYLGELVINGVLWDLIRKGIGKILKKYPKASVTIRDRDAIMYNISHDGSVNVLVTHDRTKEFAHIRHIYSLGKHLIQETPEMKTEYRKRFDLVLGIIIALMIGFFTNVFAVIFYETVIKVTGDTANFNEVALLITTFGFFASIAFLQFLVYDYKNDLCLNKNFWKRYVFYLTEDFAPFRIMRILGNIFIVIFALLILTLITASIFSEAVIIFVLGILVYVIVAMMVFFKKRKKRII